MDTINLEDLLDDIETIERAEKKRKRKTPKKVSFNGLKIGKVPSLSTEFPQRPAMAKHIIPDMCSSILFVGGTASGKTTALINMFLNEDMYRGYFNDIYLFSATGACDSLFQHLELKDENIFTTDMKKELSKLVKKLKERVEEEGTENAPRTAIIFEDLTANKQLMSEHNKDFIECFVQNRHLAVMTFACVHKWKGLTRTCRLQCHNIIYFPAPMTDIRQLMEDTQTEHLTKRQYQELIEFAHTPDETTPRPFLHINRKVSNRKEQFRKGYDRLINLDSFRN